MTFWRELRSPSRSTPQAVALLLRQLHGTAVPEQFELSAFDPFSKLTGRLRDATVIDDAERGWLHYHVAALQVAWKRLPEGLPRCVVHGDPNIANIVIVAGRTVALDLEGVGIGPPEWDLVTMAFEHFTIGTMTDTEWKGFCEVYGHDVTKWPGFETLRDIKELRKATFAIQMASEYPHLLPLARHRLACIRGGAGPRPWHWTSAAM